MGTISSRVPLISVFGGVFVLVLLDLSALFCKKKDKRPQVLSHWNQIIDVVQHNWNIYLLGSTIMFTAKGD